MEEFLYSMEMFLYIIYERTNFNGSFEEWIKKLSKQIKEKGKVYTLD